MAKVTGGLFSLEAKGKVFKLFFQNLRRRQYVRFWKGKKDKKSAKQQEVRWIYQKAIAAWRALTDDERAYYNNLAKEKIMTGFDIFYKMFCESRYGGQYGKIRFGAGRYHKA